jgi:hypothetical protein
MGSLFVLFYTYLWKFSLHCGNNRGVLGLSRTPCQGISRVSGIRDRIFSSAFYHKVRFRKFLSRDNSQFGHFRYFSAATDLVGVSVLTCQLRESERQEVSG